MSSAFCNVKNFNEDISNWDTRNVKLIHSMFLQARKIKCDLSKWNVNEICIICFLNIDEWNVSNKNLF